MNTLCRAVDHSDDPVEAVVYMRIVLPEHLTNAETVDSDDRWVTMSWFPACR